MTLSYQRAIIGRFIGADLLNRPRFEMSSIGPAKNHPDRQHNENHDDPFRSSQP